MTPGKQFTELVVEAFPAHLLQTNDPPSASEAHRVRRVLAEVKAREAASLGLENPVRTGLQDIITNCETILSPIRYLPPELVGKIILHALERGFHDPRPRPTRLDTREGVWVYGQVCRLWRQEVLSHPSVWANLYISAPFRWSSLEILKTALARSLNQSITMTVHMGYSDSNSAALLSVLAAESCRWRTVHFGALHKDLIIKQLPSIRDRLPRLESLAIRCREDDFGTFMRPFSNCPTLRSFSTTGSGFADFGVVQLPWSQITHFRQHFTRDLASLLQKLTNVVYLETAVRGSLPNDPIRHARLRTLDLCDTDIDVYTLLELPELSDLSIGQSDLYELIETCVPPTVRSIRLDFCPDWVTPGLSKLLSLTTLNLMARPDPEFLAALIEDSSVLPCLEQLLLEWEILWEDELTTQTLTLARSRLGTLKEITFYPVIDLPEGDLNIVENNYRRFRTLEKEKDQLIVGFRVDVFPFSDHCY